MASEPLAAKSIANNGANDKLLLVCLMATRPLADLQSKDATLPVMVSNSSRAMLI
jgi:hypothetical protein